MHYGVPGVHLAICQCTRELVVCGELVEYWRDDRYFVAGDGLPFFLRLGASQREGKEGQGCMSVKKSGIGGKQDRRHRGGFLHDVCQHARINAVIVSTTQAHEGSCDNGRAISLMIPEYSATSCQAVASCRNNTRHPRRAIGSQDFQPRV